MKKRKLKWLYLIICFTALLACQKFEEGKWKGTIEEEDGVAVVKNPGEPMYRKEVVAFEEELSIGESEGPEESLVSNITSFTVDDEGNVIILDIRLGIKVFDKNGKYLRSIGRKGQGPGELQGPRNIQFTAQKEIMINDMGGKGLLFFSVEGLFLSEIKNRIFMLNSQILIDERRNIFVLGPFLGIHKTGASLRGLRGSDIQGDSKAGACHSPANQVCSPSREQSNLGHHVKIRVPYHRQPRQADQKDSEGTYAAPHDRRIQSQIL